jgi:hypothetical protein
MRTVRNITVCVTPEIERQARLYAAQHDVTVSAMMAYLLQALPKIPILPCVGRPRKAETLRDRPAKTVKPPSADLPPLTWKKIEILTVKLWNRYKLFIAKELQTKIQPSTAPVQL